MIQDDKDLRALRALLTERSAASDNREVKHDVYGGRQTAKITSDFLFFSCNP